MRIQFCTQFGYATVSFSEIPPVRVRDVLKGNGFRWNRATQSWGRRRVAGSADIVTAIEKMLRPANAPDGKCWKCGKPGRFRQYGAATPVLCDDCAK